MHLDLVAIEQDAILVVESTFLVVMDEVTTRSVRTDARRVVRLAEVRLVLRMADERPHLATAVRELALVAVLASTVLFERPTQFRLVAAEVARRRRRLRVDDDATAAGEDGAGARVRFADAAVERRPAAEQSDGGGPVDRVGTVAAAAVSLT